MQKDKKATVDVLGSQGDEKPNGNVLRFLCLKNNEASIFLAAFHHF